MISKIIKPIFIGVWVMIIGMITYVSGSIHELQAEGIISYEVVSFLDEKIIPSMMGIGMVASVCIYGWIHYVVKKITDPIHELTEEAKQFGKNQYTHTLRQYEIEEINGLAIGFDKMGERFYRALRKVEYQKTKAESILAHIEDGILVLDKEGYIVEQNSLARGYLEIQEEVKKCHIKHVLRDMTSELMLKNGLEKGQAGSCEIMKNGRIFHIRLGLIGEGENRYGYMMTVTDVTKTRQLEAMRYQFVTNVTHELKTPLTSIQGFVETLQNGALENKDVAKRFLDIIDIETKRLYRLIQDILLLSEIENMDHVCNEEVKLLTVIEEVVALLEEEANKKEISLSVVMEEEILLHQVSRDHIKQVVVNLLSNAIKYTDAGEVCIHLGKDRGKSILKVSDTGIGIPREHMTHVFERFYRVDKSRSRKSGGTGLGLSIVKHIVQFYHWEIEVESEENKGSTFKIIF